MGDCPRHRRGKPVGGADVLEGAVPAGSGLARQAVEDGDHHGPGGFAVGGECVGCGAVHEAVLVDIGHVLHVPVPLLDIGKGGGGGGRGGPGQQGQGETEGEGQAKHSFLHRALLSVSRVSSWGLSAFHYSRMGRKGKGAQRAGRIPALPAEPARNRPPSPEVLGENSPLLSPLPVVYYRIRAHSTQQP